MLLGFAGVFRRSERLCIDIEYLGVDTGGVSVQMCYSKINREGTCSSFFLYCISIIGRLRKNYALDWKYLA